MCLFKRDDQENTCVHEECKNYYFKNKQTCLKTNIDDHESQNLLDLLQKRIHKTEKEMQPLYGGQVPNDANFNLNQMLFAQMMTAPLKQEFLMPNPAGMYLPFLGQQNVVPQNINISLQQALSGGALGMPNMQMPGTNLNQLNKMKPQNNMAGAWQNGSQKLNEGIKTETTDSDDNSMKDYQTKLFNLVLTQNKILTELKEKHDVLEDAMKCLLSEVSTLKHTVKVALPEALLQQSNPSTMFTKHIGNSSENINADTLLNYLYGENPDFQYQIVLKKNLDLPLYRERNFKFTVLLVDKNGKLVENTNRITLSLGIYSSESPPKFIESNTAGNKILKGFIEKDMVYGSASFEKIQIREVTSHFRNGWIFFVVYPKLNVNGNMITVNGNANYINSQKIRPLILEKVIVKAKKTKEKDAAAEADENCGDDADQEKDDKNSTSD